MNKINCIILRCVKVCHSAELYQKVYNTSAVVAVIAFAWVFPVAFYTPIVLEIGGK